MNSMHLICLMMLSSNDLSVASAHLKFDYFSLVIEGLFFLLIIFLRMKVACIKYDYHFFLFISVDNDSSNANPDVYAVKNIPYLPEQLSGGYQRVLL